MSVEIILAGCFIVIAVYLLFETASANRKRKYDEELKEELKERVRKMQEENDRIAREHAPGFRNTNRTLEHAMYQNSKRTSSVNRLQQLDETRDRLIAEPLRILRENNLRDEEIARGGTFDGGGASGGWSSDSSSSSSSSNDSGSSSSTSSTD